MDEKIKHMIENYAKFKDVDRLDILIFECNRIFDEKPMDISQTFSHNLERIAHAIQLIDLLQKEISLQIERIPTYQIPQPMRQILEVYKLLNK